MCIFAIKTVIFCVLLSKPCIDPNRNHLSDFHRDFFPFNCGSCRHRSPQPDIGLNGNKQTKCKLSGRKIRLGERDSNATKTLECVRGRRVEPGKGEKKICSGKRRKVDVSNLVNVLGDWKNTRTLGTCSIMYWFSLLSIGSHRLLMFDILHNRCTTL